MKKLSGWLLFLLGLFFLLIFFPKTLAAVAVLLGGFTGHLKATPYETGRLMGNATAALIIYVFFFFLFGLGLKLAFNLRFWKRNNILRGNT
jgi:hypothetical protein